MPKIFTILLLLISYNLYSQKLSSSDLGKLTLMDLNSAETFLSQKKFDFKEIKDYGKNEKYYAFSYNLDKFGKLGEEHIVIAIDNVSENVNHIWYQLNKDGWTNLKNSLIELGYKKTTTEAETDGSLSTVYKNSVFKFIFNVGKTLNDYKQNVFLYTLSVRKNN